MKLALKVILISILLCLFLPIISENLSADNKNMVLFYEVNPSGSSEGFSLYNYGNEDIDLYGYSVTDGEGTILFGPDVKIKSLSRITFVKEIEASDNFSNRTDTISLDSENIEKTGNFIIADNGDDLYLFKDDKLLDTVCFGSKTSTEGWIGDPVQISSKKHLLRNSVADTNSSVDWTDTKHGYTDILFNPDLLFESNITPFTFPECNGEPIYDTFENAKDTILISIYLLTSKNLIALLCELESREVNPVDVTVLLEGAPLGYDISTELALMRSLVDAGGEVRLINDPKPGNDERYSFFHNKYAIVDESKTIITSENWTESNMSNKSSNRGWGTIIESYEFADYMIEIFNNDIDKSYGDVWNILDYYPNLKPYSGDLLYERPDYIYESKTYSSIVTPIVSPDNSYAALQHYMNESEVRIYSQQLDLGSSFRIFDKNSPITWMNDAASKGVDSKFILDNSIDDNEPIVNMINLTTKVKAIPISGGENFDTNHNKGIIIDDTVWIGSVNWTENSFKNNREVVVLIDSKEVTEFFVNYFDKDWGKNIHTIEEDFFITLETKDLTEDSIAMFSVNGPEGSNYNWDVYGDGNIRTSNIPKIICTDLIPGTHTMTVNIEGTKYSAELNYNVLAKDVSNEDTNLMIPAIGVTIIGTSILIIRGRYYKKSN